MKKYLLVAHSSRCVCNACSYCTVVVARLQRQKM